ncbi:MAG: ABC transporter ATP-binding protein [Alphaproteobacteria bacterium]|nr:MAG: ABC transporter ATP-binding protein [Alphaproteobacteria bacterium]
MAAIGIERLAIGYGDGRPVLANVTLDIAAGQFVAIVGASGVGKSTLLRVIAGLHPARQGRVSHGAVDRADGRGIGFVFQDARLLPWRRVRANVELGLEGLGLSKAERRTRAEAALSLVGLADHGGRWPYQLSGGQKQRVGIARALAVRPSLLLMDEPFGALDAITRSGLQDELHRLRAATDATVLFVTHDVDEAVYLADRVILLAGSPAGVALDLPVPVDGPRHRDDPSLAALAEQVRRALADPQRLAA